ncbi:fumarylacetoacetase [Methylovirgula sp. 4M-Z18]|uniref:fumarylacetoacetase n=1 Tax=Methylovirgula sp. 4M-Z18 TaxID=2293567 RepID=UPI00403FB297
MASANAPLSDFPIQNLPYGVFSTAGALPRVGVAIGDSLLDLALLEKAGVLVTKPGEAIFARRELNPFMALGPKVWQATRRALSDLLEESNPRLRDDAELRQASLVPMASAKMHLPIFVRSFTDFYASREHATNVGVLFRDPANALMPNWLHIPIGYNGRASTVVVSGTDIRRPLGQLKPPTSDAPVFGPCQKLDFELELGAIVGVPNPMGEPVTVAEAYDMIFGYVLLNDWSARDIQAWEYQPLGPFQAKAFATSISPWVITRAALEPFRVTTPPREKPLLPYLQETSANNFDLHLEVTLATKDAPRASVISRTNYKYMYYSAAQQLAHHAVSGCAMCIGDLLGSGTISGPTRDALGSLLEMTRNGKEPVTLDDGATRTFLQDGDCLTLSGWAAGDGHRIGFGTCAGAILPAPVERDWRAVKGEGGE